MFYLSLLVALVAQVQGAATQEAPAQEPPPPTYDQGPLRIEWVAMMERRVRSSDPDLAARMVSDLRLQFRVQGDRVTKIVRHGNLILTEMTDDTGKSVFDPNQFTEEDKTSTRPLMFPVERLRENGLPLQATAQPAARAAKTIKTIRGYARLILADETTRFTIDNPLQYYGKVIDDPRLKQLGLEIEMVPAHEIENPPPPERSIILRMPTKFEHVQGVSFVDGWMRPLPARESPVNKKTGERCQLYLLDPGMLNDDLQMVLAVHPQIDDVKLPLDLSNVELP